MGVTFGATAFLALLGTGFAALVWPAQDPEIVKHSHGEPAEDPHLAEGDPEGETRLNYVIDDEHPRWPG